MISSDRSLSFLSAFGIGTVLAFVSVIIYGFTFIAKCSITILLIVWPGGSLRS